MQKRGLNGLAVTKLETPFLTSIGRAKASNVLHEWQTDSLASASATNAVLEGDDATTDSTSATTRLSNSCQISDKVPRVTGTQQAIVSAGRKDELAYQIVKRAKELRRDMESSLTANNAEVTGNSTTARELGGLEAWYTSNVSRDSGGSSGSAGNTAATDGTQRDVTEAMIKTVVKSCWDNGGDPDCFMCGSWVKQKISEMNGNATREVSAKDQRLYASIDIYHGDFGVYEIAPNRFSRARSLHILQKDMWAVAYLRPVRMANLAKTGDSERRQLIVEYTLESRNEAASGIVADLNTS